MKPESLTTDADELIPCISCLAENRRFESFCHRCGAPVSTTATLAPVQTIQTEGFLLRKALERRPKLMVLVGVWILHLPVLVLGVCVAIFIIFSQRGIVGFFFFWVMIALSTFAAIILYRITKNYLTIPK